MYRGTGRGVRKAFPSLDLTTAYYKNHGNEECVRRIEVVKLLPAVYASLEPQSRCGDKPFKFQVLRPQNGTAVLKGLRLRRWPFLHVTTRYFNNACVRAEYSHLRLVYIYTYVVCTNHFLVQNGKRQNKPTYSPSPNREK